jgi:hypothetical protein
MKKFFSSMLSSATDSVSSKRFIALGSFFFLIAAGIADIVNKRLTVTEFIFLGFLGLITACLGLSTIANVKAMDVKSDVASSIVKEQPEASSAQDAKDVLTSDKPQ